MPEPHDEFLRRAANRLVVLAFLRFAPTALVVVALGIAGAWLAGLHLPGPPLAGYALMIAFALGAAVGVRKYDQRHVRLALLARLDDTCGARGAIVAAVTAKLDGPFGPSVKRRAAEAIAQGDVSAALPPVPRLRVVVTALLFAGLVASWYMIPEPTYGASPTLATDGRSMRINTPQDTTPPTGDNRAGEESASNSRIAGKSGSTAAATPRADAATTAGDATEQPVGEGDQRSSQPLANAPRSGADVPVAGAGDSDTAALSADATQTGSRPDPSTATGQGLGPKPWELPPAPSPDAAQPSPTGVGAARSVGKDGSLPQEPETGPDKPIRETPLRIKPDMGDGDTKKVPVRREIPNPDGTGSGETTTGANGAPEIQAPGVPKPATPPERDRIPGSPLTDAERAFMRDWQARFGSKK